jgi:lipopolysaccharide export system protein LptC
MEFSQELILAIIGLIAAAAITISVVIKNNKKVTKTTIKQKGDNPQAYVNSKVNNSKKVGK